MGVVLHQSEQRKILPQLQQRWASIPVAVIVDLHTSVRQLDPAIRCLLPAASQPRLFAPVVTAHCEPPDFGAVMHSLEVLVEGDVLLIAADGWSEHAMIGDILGGYLKSRGIAGVICDGAVRDTATLAQWPSFPVYTRHTTPRGPVGADSGAVNAEVTFGNVSVKPGDWAFGDADGLAVLSPEEMTDLIEAAEDRVTKETEWETRLAAGELPSAVFGF
ncbi:MAG: RraA family protein [Granulosicoccus sp.]